MAATESTPGYMTPRSPHIDWSETVDTVEKRDEIASLPRLLGSPAPVSQSLPTLPPTPPIYAVHPKKMKSRILAKAHAANLKARLQLAYFRVKTDQVNVPLNQIVI